MPDKRQTLDERVAALTDRLAGLEGRLGAIEARIGQILPEPGASPPAIPEEALPWPYGDVAGMLALVGRTLLALGGGYFLRALTESAVVGTPVGVGLGLIYGAAWIAIADRAGHAGKSTSAVFHALSATLLVFPLVVEATLRFAALTPPAGAAILTAYSSALLLTAARLRLTGIAWLTALGTVAAVLTLMIATGEVVATTGVLILLGIGTLWLGYTRDWIVLRWPVAALANFTVLIVTLRQTSPAGDRPATIWILLLQLLLFGGYVASFTGRTLGLGRTVIPFEVFQTFAVVAIGYGGAIFLARATGTGMGALGWSAVFAGCASYVVAFAWVERRHGRRNFYFYGALALVLTLMGASLLLGATALAFAWTALGVATTVLAHRYSRITLSLHGAVYLLAAAIAAGTLRYSADAMLGAASAMWPPLTAGGVVVLAGAVASLWPRVSRAPARETWLAPVPKVAILLLAAWMAAGVVIGTLAPPLTGAPGPGADAGALATLRTLVLVVAALLLGWISRFDRFREAGWLVYPVLAATALKLIAQDFVVGRPATLFGALAAYGIALILGPRLLRGRHSAGSRQTQ